VPPEEVRDVIGMPMKKSKILIEQSKKYLEFNLYLTI